MDTPQIKEYLRLTTGATFGGEANFLSQEIGSFTQAKVDYIRVWKIN